MSPPTIMKRIALHLALMSCLLSGCVTLESLNAYESDELIAVKHNQNSDCTLLIYRDPLGQTRHVFRRHGVFELGLVFRPDGGVTLKERGRQERDIEAIEASRVTSRINTMMSVQPEERHSERLSKSEI